MDRIFSFGVKKTVMLKNVPRLAKGNPFREKLLVQLYEGLAFPGIRGRNGGDLLAKPPP